MQHRLNFAAVILAGLLPAFSPGTAGAATQQLKADLATDPGTQQIVQVAPGDYTVLIVNKVPKAAYNIQVEVDNTPVPMLPIPVLATRAVPMSPDCTKLENATTSINNSDDEKMVAAPVADIGQILQANTCNVMETVTAAKSAVAHTLQSVDGIIYTLDNGQDLKVTVTRTGTPAKTWTFIFRTPSLGNWFSSYGFVFTPNRDERYFSQLKPGSTNRYLITREAANSGSDFSPSLFYAWLPTSRENKALSLGASAGLGFDQSNPIVFVGPMLTYHQNISLVAGLVFQKQKRLNGMYTRNQEIGENLTGDQLTEQTYKPNFFFGLSFRFGANPFASTGNDAKPVQKTQGKTPEAPK
jgi:hypothetical protein